MNPSSPPPHAWRVVWAGLGAALLVALFGVFGPHSGSVWGVQSKLKAAVEEALARTAVRGASVEMEGQTARLVGVAPTEEVRKAAIEAAQIAAGRGGPLYGGVVRVIGEDLIVGRSIADHAWRAALRDGQVVLSGYAATTRTKRRLLARARDAFSGAKVVDAMRLAPGAPQDAWVRTAESAITQLARLREGEARLSDTHLVLLGDGDERAVNDVRNYYRLHPPEPYRTRIEVEVTGEGLGIVDLGDIDLSRGSAEACQAAFVRMMARNVINFRPETAEIDRSSQRLLDQLTSIALRCDSHLIEIGAHTDNAGQREATLSLSQRRAEAVAERLASQGVTRTRLRAIGYGPDRPRASNATAVGQAANRRIEFSVSG